MAAIQRIRVAWSGTPVTGPGLTTFFSDPAVAPMSAAQVVAFFTAIKALFPSGITWDVPSGGDTIEETTGALISVWNSGGGAQVASSGGAVAFSAGVGARMTWTTGLIHHGRRVRGSTYLVPLIGTAYDTQGTINNSAITTFETAGTSLITALAGGLCVWSRPGPKGPGIHSPITLANVPDKVSWLRSRRV